jgi:hypothetical protein|tara:strand:- start:95 stop:427 length:333 start_codon:yes stop_codon:yes gene_type:complete
MAYAKIENNIVVFKTYETDATLTEIPDVVCCGMIQKDDGSFSDPPKQFDDEIGLLRDKRNKLLAETDWRANSDLNISTEWKNYRQNLRDITEGLKTVDDVKSVTWPTKPE